VQKPFTDVGIVFQDHALLDWRSVMGNVMLQIEMRKLPLERYRDRAAALLERVGLAGFEGKYPFELSGGMRQRAAICRALVHDPPALFFDEPFGALDALTREQMRIDLEKLWLDRRPTVLFITHGIAEAVLLADRVVVMTPRPGRVDRVLTIDLPRPRDKAVQASDKFAHYVEEITECFMAHGVIRY
jgi:NitT/TauT family transport system ATP-binding protein